MIAVTIAIFAALTLFDLPRILREKKWRELAVYSLMATVALIYMLCFVTGHQAFSAIKYLSEFAQNVLGLNYEHWQGHA